MCSRLLGIAFLAALAVASAACGASNGTTTPAGGDTNTGGTLPGTGSGPVTGDTITTDGASVTVPYGCAPTAVTIRTTSDAAVNDRFELFGAIFEHGTRAPYEVRVNTGTMHPLCDTVRITMKVPPEVSAAGGTPAVFVFMIQESDWDRHEGVELLDSHHDTIAGTVAVDLSTGFFNNERTGNFTYEAVLVMTAGGGLLGMQSLVDPRVLALDYALTSTSRCPQGVKNVAPPFGTKRNVVRGGEFGNPRTITKDGVTQTIGHPGVDYPAQSGDTLVSAGAGTVIAAKGPIPGATGWDNNGGAGGIVVVETAGGRVTYMHMESVDVKPGDTVSEGQPVGKADDTGFSKGSHLHMEYKPKGSRSRVDPDACIHQRYVYEGQFSFNQGSTPQVGLFGKGTVNFKEACPEPDEMCLGFEGSVTATVLGFITPDGICSITPSTLTGNGWLLLDPTTLGASANSYVWHFGLFTTATVSCPGSSGTQSMPISLVFAPSSVPCGDRFFPYTDPASLSGAATTAGYGGCIDGFKYTWAWSFIRR